MPTAACAHVLRGNASLPRCCSDAVPVPLVLQVLQLAFRIYMTQKKVHDAMRVALRLNEVPLIEQSFGEQGVQSGWALSCSGGVVEENSTCPVAPFSHTSCSSLLAAAAAGDKLERRQLGYLLARQGVQLDLEDGPTAVEVRVCERCEWCDVSHSFDGVAAGWVWTSYVCPLC